MPDVTCSRCGQTRSGFDRAPFPGQIGARVVQEICQQCWSDWLKQQTMLINHYGLNVMDPQARAFLTNNMTAFLFKSGRARTSTRRRKERFSGERARRRSVRRTTDASSRVVRRERRSRRVVPRQAYRAPSVWYVAPTRAIAVARRGPTRASRR